MIDIESLNPDWKKAEEHGLSCRPGKAVQNDYDHGGGIYQTLLCPCCLNVIEKQPINLCENVKELDFLGFGFPLFYDFLTNCVILLVVLIFSYSVMSLFWAIKNNTPFCTESPSLENNILDFSQTNQSPQLLAPFKCFSFMIQFSRLQKTLGEEEVVLRAVSFIVHMLALLYLRNKHRVLKEYYRERTTLISDYSILITGMPIAWEMEEKAIQNDAPMQKNEGETNINNEISPKQIKFQGLRAKLQRFFHREFLDSPKVQQITFVPEILELQKCEHEKTALVAQKLKILKKVQKRAETKRKDDQRKSKIALQTQSDVFTVQQKEKIKQIELQLISIKKQIHRICQSVDQDIRQDRVQSEKLIITFNSQAEKKKVLYQFDKLDKQTIESYFGTSSHSSIRMQSAPQPREIIWENINVKDSVRLVRLLMGWGLSIVFLVVVTIVFYLLLNKKSQIFQKYIEDFDADPEQNANDYRKGVALVYSALIGIIIFNKFAMTIIMHQFSHYERHYTTANEQFSFALKYALGLFFTTALMTLAVEAFTFRNYFKHHYGVIEQQSVMFFLNSLFVPLIWLTNPLQLIKLVKQRLLRGTVAMTQKQANQLMEDSHYNLGKRYAQILQTMWFTFLYSTLIPFGAFLALPGLIFYYAVDKYNLLRRSAVHSNISEKLSKWNFKLLDLTLMLRPLGELIFDSQLRSSTSGQGGAHPMSLVLLLASLLFMCVPWGTFLSFLTQQKFKLNTKKYQQVRYKFTETYHSMHPVYRELYLQQHLSKRNLTMGIIFPNGQQIVGSDVRINTANNRLRKPSSSQISSQ